MTPLWPSDVTTFLLTFGPYTKADNTPAFGGLRGRVTPSARILHSATGVTVIDKAVTFRINDDGIGQVLLPHTGQASLTPSAFTYTVRFNGGGYRLTPGNAVIEVPASLGASVDFDDLRPVPGTDATRGVSAVARQPLTFTQPSPAASWSIPHPYGRFPVVVLYVGGVQVDADVEATPTTVHVTFPEPTAGVAVLT